MAFELLQAFQLWEKVGLELQLFKIQLLEERHVEE